MKHNQHLITFFAILALSFAVLFNAIVIVAVSDFNDLQYPIEELGSCESQSDCKEYCDNPDNSQMCLNFAVEEGLMSSKEIAIAKKFLNKEFEGPGGCTSKEECEEYCNDMSHINECVDFAEKNNLLSSEELREFKKIQSALKRGVTPPPCKNKEDCELYCEDPSHMKECITFGKEAGFLQGRELEEAEKMLSAIERGVTPPPCRGRESCEQYCIEPEHMEMCVNFAIEAGFMTGNEKEEAEKMLEAVRKGVKPPRCGGREECDAYCSLDENFDECINFAEAAGFMNSEELEIAKKTRGKGPGGCTGKEQCESFCQNPENQQICFNFAKENGLISGEELQKMEEGQQQLQRGLEQMPSEVRNCLEEKLGSEALDALQQGGRPSQDIESVIRGCSEMMRPNDEQGSFGDHPDGAMPPSGLPCQSPEECEKLRMMQEQKYQEMINQQGEEQYRQQQEQPPLPPPDEQPPVDQPPPPPPETAEPPKTLEPEPTGFRDTFIGSLLTALLQFLMQ